MKKILIGICLTVSSLLSDGFAQANEQSLFLLLSITFIVFYLAMRHCKPKNQEQKVSVYLFLIIIFLSTSTSAIAESGRLDVRVENGLVSINADQVSAKAILTKLKSLTNLEISVHDKLPDKLVSGQLQDLPLTTIEGVRRLLGFFSYENTIIVYDSSTHATRIFVLPTGAAVPIPGKNEVIITNATLTTVNEIAQIKGKPVVSTTLGSNGASIQYVSDEVLIRFQRGLSEDQKNAVLLTHKLQQLQANGLQALGYIKVRITDGRDMADVVRELRKDPAIAFPEPNLIAKSMAVSDPLYPQQWSLVETGIEHAWTVNDPSNSVIVAVLDTGVDSSHEDLAGQLLSGYDFVNNDDDARDDNGQGTFVTGVIAAAANSTGIRGVYPKSHILPVKVLNAAGVATYEDVAQGIVYAVDKGAKVINLSLGGYGYSNTLQAAVDYAFAKGAIVVAAGGNDGLKQEIYPAGYQGVIGVSALAGGSKHWLGSNQGRHIAVAAPGVDIISTGLGNSYIYGSGTSASAAMVSGLAAYISATRNDLSNRSRISLIKQTAKNLGEPGWDAIYGYGEIDAYAAQTREVRPIHDVAIGAINIEPVRVALGDNITVTVDAFNVGTFVSETADITLNMLSADGKPEVGKVKGIELYQRKQIEFKVPYRDVSLRTVTFEAHIQAAADAAVENNSLQSKTYTLQASSGVSVLYKVEPPTHEWIALQAFNKLPASVLKTEIQNYLPTDSNSLEYASNFSGPTNWNENADAPYCDSTRSCPTALIEGSWEEDEGHLLEPINHFWDPDSAYDKGLSIPFAKSALQMAQETAFKNALANYPASKAKAYYWLGRTAHLLMDMSVPAHTLLDEHLLWDNYEDYTGDHYKNITSSSDNTKIPDVNQLLDFPRYTPFSYDGTVTKLFYNLAGLSNDFDSDDTNGKSSAYGNGKFRFGRKEIENKTVTSVEQWHPCITCAVEVFGVCIVPKPDTCFDRNLTKEVDYDVNQNSCENRIYFYETYYNHINNTSLIVKVRYEGGARTEIENLDENIFNDVQTEPIACVYQPKLQTRATGYVGSLYQRFWQKTHGGVVRGIVSDSSSGTVLQGAIAALHRQSDSFVIATAVTDKEGVFYFNDAEIGSYFIEAYKDNFNGNSSASFTVAGGDDHNVGTIELTFVDSDGDSIGDYDEINKYFTDPHNADSDGDGLADGQEITLGTNPKVADSDGDGIPDDSDPRPLSVTNLAINKVTLTSSPLAISKDGFNAQVDVVLFFDVSNTGTVAVDVDPTDIKIWEADSKILKPQYSDLLYSCCDVLPGHVLIAPGGSHVFQIDAKLGVAELYYASKAKFPLTIFGEGCCLETYAVGTLLVNNTFGSERIPYSTSPEKSTLVSISLEPSQDTNVRTDLDLRRNDNYGMQQFMAVGTGRGGDNLPYGAGDAMRALLRFDLTKIPASIRYNAILELSLHGFEGASPAVFKVDVHRIDEPWQQGNGFEGNAINRPPGATDPDNANGVVWEGLDADNQTQPIFDAATIIASNTIDRADFATIPSGSRIQWDVSSVVKDWLSRVHPNYGLMLRDVTSDGSFHGIRFGTREGKLINPPSSVKSPRLVLAWEGGDIAKGDIIGDGCVDQKDLNILLTVVQGSAVAGPSLNLDLNGDGAVNIADARYLVTQFSQPKGAACQIVLQ